MSKATLTLKLWDDRRKPGDVANSEPDLQISTMPEGQFRFAGMSDPVVISSQQANALADFLASNANTAEDGR